MAPALPKSANIVIAGDDLELASIPSNQRIYKMTTSEPYKSNPFLFSQEVETMITNKTNSFHPSCWLIHHLLQNTHLWRIVYLFTNGDYLRKTKGWKIWNEMKRMFPLNDCVAAYLLFYIWIIETFTLAEKYIFMNFFSCYYHHA